MARAAVSARVGTAAILVAATVAGAMWAAIARAGHTDDAMPEPLEGRQGSSERGRALVLDRAAGNCLICHEVPVASEPFQGALGPDLSGVGARLSAGQLRARMVDQSRLNPQTVMPPYYRTEGLTRVAEKFRGQPVLSAQEIEDVIAWLATLK